MRVEVTHCACVPSNFNVQYRSCEVLFQDLAPIAYFFFIHTQMLKCKIV